MVQTDFFRLEMSNEIAGMNSGISSSGSGYCNRFASNSRQGFFQRFLNRNRIRLNLPTVKMSAFVGEFDEIPLCQEIDFLQK
jgi:hypothetical protein